jgi:heme-degrading monooxygenase HmoA
MIERHWKGTCKPEHAARYRDHLTDDTFKQLATIAGYRGARLLLREVNAGTEFLVITLWDSLEVIRQFSGPDITRAIVPAPVQEMMVNYDQTAVHYDLIDTVSLSGQPG